MYLNIYFIKPLLVPIDASMTVPTDKIEILRSNDKLNLSDPKRKEDVLKTKDMDMKPEDV